MLLVLLSEYNGTLPTSHQHSSYCPVPLESIFSPEPEAFIFGHKLCPCHSPTHNLQWLPISLSLKVKQLVSEVLNDLALH